MREDWEAIYDEARKLTSLEERAVYLREACGEDQALREMLERLLEKQPDVDGFFGDDDITEKMEARPISGSSFEGEGDLVGRYKLLQQIGQGGFGSVWMAEQTEPVSRQVALKVIKLGMDTKEVIARFEAERQALALMDHPNIAKVLDAGATETGRPYFVMELVNGLPVTKFCDDQKLPIRDRLLLFKDICSAVNHAHQKGVIHRDLKPSNVIVTLHGEKLVPKVIDFGIAKATQQKLTDKTLFTRFEQFVGTPVYMSPEQAALSGLDIDTRSDIYSLGVLLYELLTSKPPFDAKTLVSGGYDEMRRIIREEEPPRPSICLGKLIESEQTTLAKTHQTDVAKLGQTLRGDLDLIVMKAIEKDRSRRYETANALAADIEHFLSNEPVSAVAPSAAYRCSKFVRRNRAGFAVAASLVALLVIGSVVSTWQALRALTAEREQTRLRIEADDARASVEIEKQAAVESAESLRRVAYVADMAVIKAAIDEGNVARARELLDRHRPKPDQEDIRGFEWRLFWSQAQDTAHRVIGTYEGNVGALAVSPDGHLFVSPQADGFAVRDVQTGDLVKRMPKHASLNSSAFSKDGNTLATTTPEGIALWDTKNWHMKAVLRDAQPPFAFNEPRNQFIARTDDQFVLWDTNSWSNVGELPGIFRNLAWFPDQLAVSPDGKILCVDHAVAAGRTGVVRQWDLTDFSEFPRIDTGIVGFLDGLSISSANVLAVGHQSGQVSLWQAGTNNSLEAIHAHSAGIRALAFLPNDPTSLLTGSADRTLALWDVNSRVRLSRFAGHKGELACVSIQEDGLAFISGSKDDRSVRYWRSRASEAINVRVGTPIQFDETGENLFFVSFIGNEDPSKGPHERQLELGTGKIAPSPVRISGNTVMAAYLRLRTPNMNPANRHFSRKQLFADVTQQSTVVVLNSSTNQVVRVLDHGASANLDFAAFSEDGTLLATAGLDSEIRVWNIDDWSYRIVWPQCQFPVLRMAFSADNSHLVVADAQHAKLIDLRQPNPERVKLLPFAPEETLTSIAVSPSGSHVALGTEENLIHLWSNQTPSQLYQLRGHTEEVTSLDFSRDEFTLASCGDLTVRLWHVDTRQEMVTLYQTDTNLRKVKFAPHDRALVVGTLGQEMLIAKAPEWSETDSQHSPTKSLREMSINNAVTEIEAFTGEQVASSPIDFLVPPNALWKWKRPLDQESAFPEHGDAPAFSTLGFDDSLWNEGTDSAGGFYSGESMLTGVPMDFSGGTNQVVYLRHAFTTDRPIENIEFQCQRRNVEMIVYLGGRGVCRVEANESPPSGIEHMATHVGGLPYSRSIPGVLPPGKHVLSICVRNAAVDPSDLFRLARITLVGGQGMND